MCAFVTGVQTCALPICLLEVEGYVRDFALDNPNVTLAMLRFSNVLGPDIWTPLSKALELPLTPSLMGFDPRVQLVHETDVIRAITHVLDNGVEGIYKDRKSVV